MICEIYLVNEFSDRGEDSSKQDALEFLYLCIFVLFLNQDAVYSLQAKIKD